MAWVKAENDRTSAVLEKSAHFAVLQAEALKVLESPDRIAFPNFNAGFIYNKWEDAEHARGIVRRTSLEDYLKPDPKRTTVLDYDALAKADHRSWVGEGFVCLGPETELCLASLSAGGEDAQTLREFNMKTGAFVENGFTLPSGKQNVSWIDKETLLVARNWGLGTMSESGYPIDMRMWKRGRPFESAQPLFHGDAQDNDGVPSDIYTDSQGHRAIILARGPDIQTHGFSILLASGVNKLPIPRKSNRGGPVHARKFAGRLEEFHKPFYYDEITEGGHGSGADNTQRAHTFAATFTYLMMKLMD